MSKVWLVTQFQLRELIRRRWILGVGVLCLLILIGSGIFIYNVAGITPKGADPVQVANTAGMGILSALELLVTMVAIFGTAGVLPTEFESGSFYSLLPRPVSRTQVFLGKLLGTLIVLWGLSLAITGGLALSFSLFLKLPPTFGWVVLLYPLGPTALAVLAFALSTRMRAMGAGFLTIFLSFVGGILPSLDGLAREYGKVWLKAVVGTLEVLLPLGALPNWQSKWLALIQGTGALDKATSSLISPQILTPWAFVWILLIFALGARSFQRRNL